MQTSLWPLYKGNFSTPRHTWQAKPATAMWTRVTVETLRIMWWVMLWSCVSVIRKSFWKHTDTDGQIRGHVWGRIRYFWSVCVRALCRRLTAKVIVLINSDERCQSEAFSAALNSVAHMIEYVSQANRNPADKNIKYPFMHLFWEFILKLCLPSPAVHAQSTRPAPFIQHQIIKTKPYKHQLDNHY